MRPFKRHSPNNDITPHDAQTTIHIPTEPEYFRADAGDTNIPDPIITAKMKLTAENNPSSRLS